MNESSRSTICSSCNAIFTSDDVQACPNCGSTSKPINKFKLNLSGSIQPRQRLKAVGYDPTLPSKTQQKKNRIEVRTGDDYWVDGQKWVHKEQVINKRNDRYCKQVTDPDTGEVIHHVCEPLSEHKGHGDDKGNKRA